MIEPRVMATAKREAERLIAHHVLIELARYRLVKFDEFLLGYRFGKTLRDGPFRDDKPVNISDYLRDNT